MFSVSCLSFHFYWISQLLTAHFPLLTSPNAWKLPASSKSTPDLLSFSFLSATSNWKVQRVCEKTRYWSPIAWIWLRKTFQNLHVNSPSCKNWSETYLQSMAWFSLEDMKTISSTFIKLKVILSETIDDKDDSASKSWANNFWLSVSLMWIVKKAKRNLC